MSSKPGRSQQSKSRLEKTKSGVRSICVLAPLFGVTWVFGVLSMSKDLVVFQYLFAIFNSLQVKEAIKHHSKKRKAARMDSFSYTESKTRKTSETSAIDLTPKASPKSRRSASPKNQLLTANQQEEGYSPFGRVHSPMRLSPGHLPASHWQPTIIDLGTF
ncbi:unnamed protein product [Mytilus edulis]|uniref:Uncharacterized protein n=1 Tax=Mytilus edulis TaxID=6550 RepID=A0A8S3VBE7_MYTED|nr:unnamed protein product [Mytilus edulis]